MKKHAAPVCPHCHEIMRLAHVVPGAFGLPELRSFECRACHEAVTVEVAPEPRTALTLADAAETKRYRT